MLVTFNDSSARRDGIFRLIVTGRKQNFTIGRLYSERPVFIISELNRHRWDDMP